MHANNFSSDVPNQLRGLYIISLFLIIKIGERPVNERLESDCTHQTFVLDRCK